MVSKRHHVVRARLRQVYRPADTRKRRYGHQAHRMLALGSVS